MISPCFTPQQTLRINSIRSKVPDLFRPISGSDVPLEAASPSMKTTPKRRITMSRADGETLHIDRPHGPRWKLDLKQTLGLITGIVVGVWLIVWGFLAEFPTGPASGTTLAGPIAVPSRPGKTLRVGTFNIHGGTGRDGKFDLGRTTESLRRLDLIGLNEVHRPGINGVSQAETLGANLKLNWLFAPTETCWRGEHFGSAFLTRHEVTHWQRIPLENRTANGFRNMVFVSLPLEKGTLSVIITHADRTSDREHQLRSLFTLFASLEEPALLLGDLNTRRHDPLLAPSLDSGAWTDCLGSILKDDPGNRIDWILARGVKPIDAGLINNGASDHPCAWAELDLSPYTKSAP